MQCTVCGKVLSVYRVLNFTLQTLNVAVRCQEYNFGEVKRLDLCMTVPCGHMPLCGQCKHFMGRATSISDGIFLQELERTASGADGPTIQHDHGVPRPSWQGGAGQG